MRIYDERRVAGLVPGKRKASTAENMAIAHQENATASLNARIDRFLAWKEKMAADGWTWDKNSSRFYRIQNGQQVWDKEGYFLDTQL